jgi:hypothetical protein
VGVTSTVAVAMKSPKFEILAGILTLLFRERGFKASERLSLIRCAGREESRRRGWFWRMIRPPREEKTRAWGFILERSGSNSDTAKALLKICLYSNTLSGV